MSTCRHIYTVHNQDYTSRSSSQSPKIQATQKNVVEDEDNIPDYPGNGLIQYEVKNTNLHELSQPQSSFLVLHILLHTIITNNAIVDPYKLECLNT